jgi:lysophospholipase L1-like esterase
MTIIYSQDFQTTGLGTLPSGWTASSGSPWTSGTPWSVQNTITVDGTQSAGGPTDFSAVFATASSALADMEVTFEVKQGGGFISPILRMSSDGTNGYYIGAESASLTKFNFFKLVSGSFTSMGEVTNTNPVGSVGNATPVMVRARVQGNVLYIKTWLQGSSEPSGWGATYTDTGSAITAAGYYGFVSGLNGGAMSGLGQVNLDNLVAAATDFTLTPSSQTTAPGTATGNYTITPNSTPSASTAIALSDGGAGGTFKNSPGTTITSLVFTTSTAQPFTYTPAGGATTTPIVLTATATGGFSASHTANCILNIPATGFTLTPSTLTTSAGVATGPYTVTLNGTLTSNETIALSDGSAGGTFTPSSLTFTSGNAATPQPFTYTPASGAGGSTKTLTASGTGQFTATHAASCVVSAGPIFIGVDSLFFSPGNWDTLTIGTFGVTVKTMQTSAMGAYFKFAVTGTTQIAVNIDTTETASENPDLMPTFRYAINYGQITDIQIGEAQASLTLATGLTTSDTYEVEVFLRAVDLSYDAWGSLSSGVPNNVTRIQGVTIDSTGSVSAPFLLPKRAVFFGDSLTQCEGNQDATQGWSAMMAVGLDAEYGNVGYGGTGWTISGGGNMPDFLTWWSAYSVNRPRTLTGLDYVLVFHGANDAIASVSGATIQSDCQTWLAAIRAACGANTKIILAANQCGNYSANYIAAVAAYKAASSDPNVYALPDISGRFASGIFQLPGGVEGGPFEYTSDGLHPTTYGYEKISSAYLAAIATALAGGGGTTIAGYGRARVVNA